MNGMTPEVLPTAPTFSPIERRLPQYEPMPPPFDASQTFSFHRPTMPSRLSLASFRKHEVGRPRLVPPFDRIGVEGMNHSLLMYSYSRCACGWLSPYCEATR